MKTLVVYYSRTGNTRKAGEEIARELACDAEEIVDTASRAGPLGWIKSGKQASARELTKLVPMKKDPAGYDRVVIGTPVWAGTMSTPVRTFIAENGGRLKGVAFFATLSSTGDAATFKEMEEACGKNPAATLAIQVKDLKSGAYAQALKDYANKLKA